MSHKTQSEMWMSYLNCFNVTCLLLVLYLVVLLFPGMASAAACQTDLECDDHVFCNGQERCSPGQVGADARGCVRANPPQACRPGQTCNEGMKRCIAPRTDFDGDGHASLFTNGDDCNDHDINEFPGNPEVWDRNDHDEDCNQRTHGVPVHADGTLIFGGSGRVGPIQVCSGEEWVILDGTVGMEESFRHGRCDSGNVCVRQPSGDGTCQPRPAGYVPPPVLLNIPYRNQVIDNSLDNPANNRLGTTPKLPAGFAPRPSGPLATPGKNQPLPGVLPTK